MGLLSALADAIYREYDRRIKRASVITEYGAQHHDHSADHADDTQAAHEQAAEEEAEIVNVPPGTPVVSREPAPETSTEPTEPT
jgi:hypothetical protein